MTLISAGSEPAHALMMFWMGWPCMSSGRVDEILECAKRGGG